MASLFAWLRVVSGRDLRAKADALVANFAGDCPAVAGEAKKALEKKAERALARLCANTSAYVREQRLGVIGRARFAKALQGALSEARYAPALIKQVTSAVMVNALVAPERPA